MKTQEELIDEFFVFHGIYEIYSIYAYTYKTERILEKFKLSLIQIHDRQAVSLMMYYFKKKIDQPLIPTDMEIIIVRKFLDFPLFRKMAYYNDWMDIRNSPSYGLWIR